MEEDEKRLEANRNREQRQQPELGLPPPGEHEGGTGDDALGCEPRRPAGLNLQASALERDDRKRPECDHRRHRKPRAGTPCVVCRRASAGN